MKLYTEEEIRNFFTEKYNDELSIDELIEILTPIELPSDEEIEESSPFRLGSGDYNASFSHKWQQGAIWMRDKISK